MAVGVEALFLGSVCLSLLFVVVKFLYRVLWTPIWTQKVMALQGIRGPRYRFLHGNMKEITQMKKEAMATSMGLSNDIIQKVQPQFHRWINTYGNNFIFWQGPKAQVFVSEGELMKEILNNKEKTYPKQELAPYAQKLIGNSLVSFEGEIWSKMRKLGNHAFHGESLKNLTPEMVASAEMMLERWKKHEEQEIEVFNEFKQLTSEVISRTAFGSSYVEGNDIFDKLGKVLMIAHRPPSKFKLSNIFRGSGGENEMQKLVSEMRNSILEMIRKREKKVMNGEAESYGKDFLGLLLQSCHDPDESQRITVENVIDECKGIYVAGQETTTNLLSWTIMLLAIHTDWQEEARKEVQNMFGQQIPNPDGISKLKTMGMIINETLRLYPPAMGLIRKANREVKLGKYRLPSNTNFYLSILKLHHDPKVWGEDAHLFKPERFAEGVAKATKNDVSAFCPFGIGPRTCVGFNFAITEAKIALSMILQRYSFTLSPAYVHSPVQVLLLRPQHGVQIILHPLNI